MFSNSVTDVSLQHQHIQVGRGMLCISFCILNLVLFCVFINNSDNEIKSALNTSANGNKLQGKALSTLKVYKIILSNWWNHLK